MGSQGLRAGWSVLSFLLLTLLFLFPLGFLANLVAHDVLHLKKGSFTPAAAILQELVLVLAILGGGAVVALMERRRLLDYNLTGPRRHTQFLCRPGRGLCGALGAGGRAGRGRMAALWPGGPVRRADLRLCGPLGLDAFFWSAFSKRACSAAICSSRSPGASTSGGRWPLEICHLPRPVCCTVKGNGVWGSMPSRCSA